MHWRVGSPSSPSRFNSIGCAVGCSGLGDSQTVTCLSIRHSFATRLLECGQSIRTSQELMGYSDLNTTMTYIHVLKLGSMGVISPADHL